MYKWSAEAVSCRHVVFGNEESTKWNRNSSGVHRLHQPSELCKLCLVLPVLNVRMIHPWFYDLMNSGESYCVAESKYLHGVIHILLRLDHMYTHSEYCGSSSCWKRQRQRCLWGFFSLWQLSVKTWSPRQRDSRQLCVLRLLSRVDVELKVWNSIFPDCWQSTEIRAVLSDKPCSFITVWMI